MLGSLRNVIYDPTGTKVRGTLDNCAGDKTPWGTLLTCEENFQNRFANRDALAADDPRKAIHTRCGPPTGATMQRWELLHPRFDLAQEPNEPFRFGWVVEIEPYDPTFVPKKRTALGRFRHEGATAVAARSPSRRCFRIFNLELTGVLHPVNASEVACQLES